MPVFTVNVTVPAAPVSVHINSSRTTSNNMPADEMFAKNAQKRFEIRGKVWYNLYNNFNEKTER